MFYYLELYENVVHKIIKTFLLQDTSYVSKVQHILMHILL